MKDFCIVFLQNPQRKSSWAARKCLVIAVQTHEESEKQLKMCSKILKTFEALSASEKSF